MSILIMFTLLYYYTFKEIFDNGKNTSFVTHFKFSLSMSTFPLVFVI